MTAPLGTRKFTGIRREHSTSQVSHSRFTRDVGMLKRVIVASNTTFLASSGKIQVPLGTFSAAFYPVIDPIPLRIRKTNKNDGERLLTAITIGSAATLLTIDQGVKAEGPITGVDFRTP